jgi:hypothetical protein
MHQRPLSAKLASVRDILSFSAGIRDLVEILNRQIEAPEKMQVRLRSHPAGYAREITKRRLSIAEGYLRLTTSSGVENYQARLDALETLIHEAMHSKTLSMPINTARVQIALMKECVKARGNPRRQLELMSDFARASYGQPGIIRRLLGELDLIEVPEDGRPLRDMNLGWDDHVHDFSTEGRKTPPQLLLDAFIQGISRVIVAYYDFSDPRIFEEAIEAGRILGIKVEVGVEFSVGVRFNRQHFMYIPEGSDSAAALNAFLQKNKEVLQPFFEGLATNAERRKQTIGELIERFNQTQLRQFNDRFRNQPFLQLGPLRWEDMEEITHGGQASRLHLGQLLAERIKPVLHKRVLYLKNQFTHASEKLRTGETSSWEVDNVRAQYLEARAEYENCGAQSLRDRFAGPREGADYDSAFLSPEDVLPALAACGGRIILIHPLSQGVDAAIGALLKAHRWITGIETFNLADSLTRDPADLRRLNHLVALFNRGATDEVTNLAADWGATVPERADVEAACAWYSTHNLQPHCGTDYVGRDSRVPGMGFVYSTALSRRAYQSLVKRHHTSILVQIGHLLMQGGRDDRPVEESARVLVLAPPASLRRNLVGDELEVEKIGALRFWRFLNPTLKSLIKIGIGFVPGNFVVGPWYTLLWFAITATRNVIVDLVAASGFHVRSWRLATVDRENLSNSLFWTGFSVPILGATKYGFDLVWPLVSTNVGFWKALMKFWTLAVINGAYIWTHNWLRGFDKEVARGNFFRSVFSWPLATAGSYALDLLNIPAIVQTKFWSDVVAGAVEGASKVMRRMKLSQRSLQELLELMKSPDRQTRLVAMVDILYIWARRYQGRSALKRIFEGKGEPFKGPDGELVVPDNHSAVDAYNRLIDAWAAAGSMEAMTSLLLNHYSGRDAVLLTDLVADSHLEFLRWLKRRRPKAAAGTTSNSAN